VVVRLRHLLRASQGGLRTRGGRLQLGGVRALGRQRRRCGRVKAAWVLGLCVQSSVMRDNYQSTTSSECVKPTCNHPFDSIQRADAHSTHAASTISLWGLDVVEFPQCVDSYSFEPRADAEWKIHDGHHLGVDAAAVVKLQMSQSCSRRAFAGPLCHSSN